MLGEESPPERIRTAARLEHACGWSTRSTARANSSSATANSASTSRWCEDGEPVLGVVSGAGPVGACTRAARGCGAFRRGADGACTRIHVQRAAAAAAARAGQPLALAMRCWTASSRRLGPQQRISLGSALKFGLLAEGGGDLYVRRGPTSEWDTAAGQAVVLEAGGCVVDLSGSPLRYNVRDDVTNPSFIAFGDRTRDWVALLGGL